MTRFGCNLRRIASLRRLSAGRGAPHAAGWPAAPPWPHPHRVRVVVAVGSGLMRVPESGVGSPFRSATSACLAVCLCRWCWWWVPESQALRYRMVSGSVSSLCGGVCSQGSTGVLVFSVSGRSHAPHGGAHQDTARFQTKPKRSLTEGLFGYTSYNRRRAVCKANQQLTLYIVIVLYLNLALDYEL